MSDGVELLQDTITLHLTPCALRFLQDTFVVEICTHPEFKTEEIPPAYWHVSQSPGLHSSNPHCFKDRDILTSTTSSNILHYRASRIA
ncbi:hypothetical protein CBS147332_7330 [Penicillium roqueforti]|nr:hypothetical protein CBS147332_7330 [Penicillium roqueforti]KAI3105374.1 hypothetical protein CBS147331_7065 [Penicillium roqueforti]